jgi:hypothetical protein
MVMYIAKLKDGLKRVKKTFSMTLERVFEMVWWRGWKSHQKEIFEVEVFFSSQNIDFSFIWRDSWSFFSLFFPFSLFFNTFSLSPFFYAPSLEDLGVLMIFEEKNHFFKNFLFKWIDMEWHGHDCGYTGGGLIFRNGVMHANIAS